MSLARPAILAKPIRGSQRHASAVTEFRTFIMAVTGRNARAATTRINGRRPISTMIVRAFPCAAAMCRRNATRAMSAPSARGLRRVASHATSSKTRIAAPWESVANVATEKATGERPASIMRKSSFPLLGKHVAVPCADCHITSAYKETPKGCQQCHSDVRHKGRLGAEPRCGACHNAESWRDAKFDHARLANYPLTGGHARLLCESCHKEANPPTLKLPTACANCHKDSQHRGRLGAAPKCESCHDTSGWSHWRFDHALQTRFPLTGRHEGVSCEGCHTATNPPSLRISMECHSCHAKQDAHNGAFGRFCERCHTADGWNKVKVTN